MQRLLSIGFKVGLFNNTLYNYANRFISQSRVKEISLKKLPVTTDYFMVLVVGGELVAEF